MGARVFTLLLCGLLCGEAMAASSGSTATSPTTGYMLGLMVVYLTRRRAIGGWLFYFYYQLFAGLVVTLLLLPSTINRFSPSQWDRSDLYVLDMVSTLPVVIALITEGYFATVLLRKRTQANVTLLRKSLLAVLLTSGIACVLDWFVLQETTSAVLDTMTVIFSAIWLRYFRVSNRVRMVFIDHTWDQQPEVAKTILTAAEQTYLRKRGLIWAGATFVAMVLLAGIVRGKQAPDGAIFFAAVAFAPLGFIAGRYLQLSDKQRQKIAAASNAP